MGAHLDGGQAAVVVVLAVVRTVVYRAPDALVGGAGASAVGAVLGHSKVLLRENFFKRRGRVPPLPHDEAASRRHIHVQERSFRAVPALI